MTIHMDRPVTPEWRPSKPDIKPGAMVECVRCAWHGGPGHAVTVDASRADKVVPADVHAEGIAPAGHDELYVVESWGLDAFTTSPDPDVIAAWGRVLDNMTEAQANEFAAFLTLDDEASAAWVRDDEPSTRLMDLWRTHWCDISDLQAGLR